MATGARRSRRKPKKTEAYVLSGSGNVFSDLGVPQPEEHLARAKLARKIAELITARRLTQAKAATVLGIDQPKVSALLRGRLQGFSSDRLFRFLNALGRDVEIIIRPKASHRPARTRIRRAS